MTNEEFAELLFPDIKNTPTTTRKNILHVIFLTRLR